MEKTCWEEFAKTGKVTDYLKYRGAWKQTAPGKRMTTQMTCETAEEWHGNTGWENSAAAR